MRNAASVVLILMLLICSAFSATEGRDSYVVTNPPPTLKVQPTVADAGPAATSLRIAIARGEYEPVQLVVTAGPGDLKSVVVSTSSLRGPNGAIIPMKRVVVAPQGFVNCSKVSPGATLTGEIPDVMLPNRRMSIPAGRRQPFFVTVQAVAADTPGEYRGKVKISVANAPATILPLIVHVYSLTIPIRSHLRTAFVIQNVFREFITPKEDRAAYVDACISYAKVMLSYRVSACPNWPAKHKADGTSDFSELDRFLSATVPLGLTAFDVGGIGDVAGRKDADWIRAAAKHFKERRWWDLHYLYGWDEASGELVKKLPDMYRALLDAEPSLKILQTGWSPNPPIRDIVKIWCPLTQWIDVNGCREAQKRGDEVWWYVCCLPPGPYANVFVDCPGIDQRILGWMTYRQGIQGFLYWGMDEWPGNTAPVEKYDDSNYSNWNPSSYGETFNGDGYLLYPGKNNTCLASVRLALLRDGFEDYDIFTEANTLAAKHGSAGAKLLGLLKFDAPLIKSLTEFTKDGNDLLARREAILRAAEDLAKEQQN